MATTSSITSFIVAFILMIGVALPLATSVIASLANLSTTNALIVAFIPTGVIVSGLIMAFNMAKNKN